MIKKKKFCFVYHWREKKFLRRSKNIFNFSIIEAETFDKASELFNNTHARCFIYGVFVEYHKK